MEGYMMPLFRQLSFFLSCQTHTSPSHLNASHPCDEGNATAIGSTQHIQSTLPCPLRWTLSLKNTADVTASLNKSLFCRPSPPRVLEASDRWLPLQP